MPTVRPLPILAVLLASGGCATRTVIVTEPTPQAAAALGIPKGHLPRPGECRIWIPGLPPGRQPEPKSRPCAGIAALAPAGSWILYRPLSERRLVHVRVVHDRRPGVVVRVRVFEVEGGKFVKEEEP